MTPIIEDAEESEFNFGDDYQSGKNSWAWHLPEEDEEDLSLAETWSESSAQFTPNKLDVDGFPVGGKCFLSFVCCLPNATHRRL